MVELDSQETSAREYIPHPMLERITSRIFDDELGPEHYFAVIEGLQELRNTSGDIVAHAIGHGQASAWVTFNEQLLRFLDKLVMPLDPEGPRVAKIQRFSHTPVRTYE